MPPFRNMTGALFDIKPVDAAGRLALHKITALAPEINLRGARKSVLPGREAALREIESSLAVINDPQAVLARAGGRIASIGGPAKPRYRPVGPSAGRSQDRHHRAILREISTSARLAPAEPVAAPVVRISGPQADVRRAVTGVWLDGFRQSAGAAAAPLVLPPSRRRGFMVVPRRDTRLLTLVAAVAVLAAGLAYGLFLKHRVIQEGVQAVTNLQNARAHLALLDFDAAAKDFLAAYRNFSQAGGQFKILGANIGAVLETLPGTDRLAAGRDLVEAGSLIADAGSAVTQAIGALADTRHFFEPATGRSSLSSALIAPTVQALTKSRDNVNRAVALLADIEPALLPAEHQAAFGELKNRLPEFKALLGSAADSAKFFEEFIGTAGTKRYLVLFQNYSEIRPSGGFPGSYGVATFEAGRLKEFKVDDIYNPDGQLKDLIIPPAPLQHITPNWAMRDAGWFVDFPESARKFLWFFRRETGLNADGVITISPRMIAEILKLVGPIELPAYKLTLTEENFLATVQADIEYGDNNTRLNQPKKILTDLTPLLLAKLSQLDGGQWLQVVNVALASVQRKDLLMYFKTPALQDFVLRKNLGGQVAADGGDYLMINFANVKGAKADAVTDSALAVATSLADGLIRHKVTITRTHTGGKSPYGFYNRQNPAWVRVLVPKGSQLISISGNDKPNYQPITDYTAAGFTADEDLAAFEAAADRNLANGVETGLEADKTSFGFWLITEPGATKTVELEYSVPAALARSDYSLTIQKQPGVDFQNFSFSITPSGNLTLGETEPALRPSGDSYTLTGALTRDLTIHAQFR